MCDPVTAIMAGGSLLQGLGARQQGREQAAMERDAAGQEAAVIRRAGQRQKGTAKAMLAASGVKLGEGTAGVIEDEIVAGSEHDAMMQILSGDRRARSARKAGDSAFWGSVLQAGGQAAGGWKNAAKPQPAYGGASTTVLGAQADGFRTNPFAGY